MDYLCQLNRAIDYIEKHLDAKLVIEDIAREAGISQWHFQRVFRGATGESIKNYVNARRPSKAAGDLAETKFKILDIAVNYNYSSHEAFTRAFQKHFGLSPKEFRQHPDLSRLRNIMFRPHITKSYLEHLYKGMNLKPEIKTLDAMKAYGLSSILYSANDPQFRENFKNIPALWQRLRQEIPNFEKSKLKRMAFIYSTDESKIDSALKYYASFEASDSIANLNLEKISTEKGLYAEFTHKGTPDKVDHTINYIYGVWFPKSGYRRRSGPDINIPDEKYGPGVVDGSIKILIPIEEIDN